MKNLGRSLREVFSHKSYVLLALGFFVVFMIIATLIPSLSALVSAFRSPILTWSVKWDVILDALSSFSIGYHPVQQVIIVLTVLLVSIHLSVVTYFVKKRSIPGGAGAGTVGVILSAFGLGCTACGSFLLTSLIGVTASAGVLAILPLGGSEFTLIGAGLVAYALYATAQKLQSPMVCQPARSSLKDN